MEICNTCKKSTNMYSVRLTDSGESVITCRKCDRTPIGYIPFKAYWDMNIAEKPVYIESDTQREKLMRQNGLSVRPREHIDDLNQRRWSKGLPPLEK